MLGYAAELKAAGHAVSSTWIDGHHETRPGIDENPTDQERASWAIEDIADMLDSDILIVFTDEHSRRGGSRVEMGFMLGAVFFDTLNLRRVYGIGPRICVFDCLDLADFSGVYCPDRWRERFRWWPTWEAFKSEMLPT